MENYHYTGQSLVPSGVPRGIILGSFCCLLSIREAVTIYPAAIQTASCHGCQTNSLLYVNSNSWCEIRSNVQLYVSDSRSIASEQKRVTEQ